MPTDADGDLSREFARALDAQNPLSALHDRFVTGDAIVYLGGNRLGRLPKATAEALATMVRDEWGHELARAWPAWIERLETVGDALGRTVLGVTEGQTTLADSTTVSLFKAVSAAIALRPQRTALLIERDAFSTDRFVLQSVARTHGLQIRTVASDINTGLTEDAVRAAAGSDVAVGCFSHVSYRSGAAADLPAITRALHDVGALAVWDLSHSAGAIRTPLAASGADFAVGCTHKYLNSGPGAPAFVYVKAEHLEAAAHPVPGWFSHDSSADSLQYRPVRGIGRFWSGTPNMFGVTAVEESVAIVADAGIGRIEQLARLLTGYALKLTDELLTHLGWSIASPRNASRRGAHLSIRHDDAWQIYQALSARGVVAGFRGPLRLRLGLAPLTTSFEDVWIAVEQIAEITRTGSYRHFPIDGAPSD